MALSLVQLVSVAQAATAVWLVHAFARICFDFLFCATYSTFEEGTVTEGRLTF